LTRADTSSRSWTDRRHRAILRGRCRTRTSKHSGRCTPLWPPGTSRCSSSCVIPMSRSPNLQRFPTPRAIAAMTAFVPCSRSCRTFFQTCNSRQPSSSLMATGSSPRCSGWGQALAAERVHGSRSFTFGASRTAVPLESMHFLIAGRPRGRRTRGVGGVRARPPEHLDAPPEEVWSLVGTPSRYPEWWPRLTYSDSPAASSACERSS
jgi:hypothetical protein